jgi:hypothetical protein
LSIKLEGTIDGVSIFDQVSVLREVDLHYKWAPFCSSSLTIEHLDKLDTVGWFVIGLPHFGLMRDGCFRAIGCDSIYEDGSVLLVAQGINDKPEDGVAKKSLEPSDGVSTKTSTGSGVGGAINSIHDSGISVRRDDNTVGTEMPLDHNEKRIMELLSNDPVLDSLDIPAPPTRMGSGRMTIKTFQAMIHITSATSATSKIVANIDPNLPLIPQSLLDFLMKRLCGVLMSKLQGAAKKISKDPVTNPHAIKMREEKDFYKGWLMEKFRGISKIRGWEEPEFAVFELSDAQLDVAEAYSAKKKRKTQKAIKFYHSMTDDNLDDYLDEPNSKNGADAASEPIAYVGNSTSGLRRRAVSDSSSMSELSRSSALSLWSGNPFSSYLRDVEERTQLRKAREIEKARQRAANRLKPKELDEESRLRLEELRRARAGRDASKLQQDSHVIETSSGAEVSASTSPSARQPSKKISPTSKWAVFFSNHGRTTRIVVISSLVLTLFYLLFMPNLFGEFAFAQNGSFLLQRGRDVVTIFYLTVAGTVHFFLLYVALMYSFSSLEIGRIAGEEAKRFYSDHVHLVVYFTSGSLVLLGCVKAVVSKITEWVVWNVVALCRSATKSLILEKPGTALSEIPRPLRSLNASVSTCLIWINQVILQSTVVGRTASQALECLLSVLTKLFNDLDSSFDKNAGRHEGNMPTESWREDAFATTGNFLAYSAIFVLVLLFLFNASARHARLSENLQSKMTVNDDQRASKSLNESGAGPSIPSGKVMDNGDRDRNRSKFKFNRSMSPDFDTIHEEDNHNDTNKRQ